MTKPRKFPKTDTGAKFSPSFSCTKNEGSRKEAAISLTLLLLATITVWTLIIVYL